MRKLASIIALILVVATAISMSACRTPGEGKDTTTPKSSSITPEGTTSTPDTSTTPADTTTANDTTTSHDTTTAKDTTTAPKDTTTVAPEDIEWTSTNITVYVSVNNAWVRKSPDLDDASRIEVLHLGDALTCTATSKSWMKVTYGGETRYISASCVTTDDISGNDFETVNDKVYVSVSTAWLRLGPSTDTEALSFVAKGTELTRVAKSASWSKVVIEGKTYYISNSCVSTTKVQ